MAYDDHLARLRREAYEKAVEEEAERQAREVEKARGRANELLALSYDRAMEWLENAQSSDLRFQDVVSVIRLKMDYLKAFPVQPDPRNEDEWTEEDDAEAERIFKEIIAKRDPEQSAQVPGKQDSESDGANAEASEDSEGEEA